MNTSSTHNTELSVAPPALKTNWKLVMAILKPYWQSEERWRARMLLATILGFIVALVTLQVWLNDWSRGFYNAIEKRDYAAFTKELWRFSYLAFSFIIISAYRTLLEQKLHIQWRRWLTTQYINRWLADARFYVLGLTPGKIDNPDQRIAEDVDQVVASTLSLGLNFIRNSITLVSFSFILWGISGAFSWTFMGKVYELPGYMFWFAVGYAFLGSFMIYRIGRSLVRIHFLQQRFEAGFRFNLARIREYAESIALYGAFRKNVPFAEQYQLAGGFSKIVQNWNQTITLNKRISMGSTFYAQFAVIFPFLVSAPAYFKGAMSLGDLMQVSRAFGQVQDAMSWFIDVFPSLANWKAGLNRLVLFEMALQEKNDSQMMRQESQNLALQNIVLASPVADLTEAINIQLIAGSSVLIQGPSGCGKSTLLRTLSGIYPFGRGTLLLDQGKRTLFIPQKSYLPHTTLQNALCYPALAQDFSRERIEEVLRLCHAEQWIDALDSEDNWSQRLSLGEQQRLSFARILLLQPDYIFLDEATSALDEVSEAHLYLTLIEQLQTVQSDKPASTIVSVAHRVSVAQFHNVHWTFTANDAGLYRVNVS